MTQTPTTANHIPAAGLRAELANGVVVSAMYANGAGYKVQVRINGAHQPKLGGLYTFDGPAIAAYNQLVAEHTPTTVETAPASAAVKLAAPAKGAATKVSDPQHTALAVAVFCGSIQRGGHEGQASVKTLTALAKRNYLDLTYETGRTDARKVVTGGTITGPGRTRLAELTAVDRELAAYTARLAANLTFDTQPATAPVAA